MPDIYGQQPVCGPNGGPVPVTLDGGSVTIESVTVPTSVSVNNGNAAPVPVSDGDASLSIDDGGNSITVDGPLTDQQLRASAVPVTGALTDTELRANPVPVSGPVTDLELRAEPLPVAGPLTNIQLRAEPVPVVISSGTPRTPTTTSVAGTTSSTLILAGNANRKGFSVCNLSTSKLYLSFSTPATLANCFIEMVPASFLVFDQELIVTSAIYGIWTGASGTCQVTEFV